MREIPKKNYVILLLLLIGVVLVTFMGARIYNNNIKQTTPLYKYLKVTNSNEINLYLKENPSTVIYISDRYDITKNNLEETLKNKIVEYSLYDYFVYLDKSQLNEKFLKRFNENNNLEISIDKLPILLIFNDDQIISYYSLDDHIIETINYEEIR